MKRFAATLLILTMAVCAMSMLALPVSASVEGDWVTSRAADDYQDPDSYRPACGYQYDLDKGLRLISADYTNNTPYTHVHTKNRYNLKDSNADGKGNSISIELTVTDFAYGGENDLDHWVSFSLHSQEIFAPGQTGFGEGVSVLIRGAGKGTAIAQFFSLDDDNGYALFSMKNITIPVNDQGHEVYTFEVKYNDWGYTFYLCGQEFYDEGGIADAVLEQYCADGAYVGASFYTGVTGSNIEAYINKFQGQIPYGEDSAEPEENLNNYAPIVDSFTVAEGQPAVIWNASKEQFKDFKGSNLEFAVNDDGTVQATIKTGSGFVIFSPKVSVSYQATDFPVIAVLTRDCYAEYGSVYYSAGKIQGAQPNCCEDIDIAEYDFGQGWCMGILDLTGDVDWNGRINMIRVDFVNIDHTDEETRHFDIAYIAAFRTIEDAEKYANDYLVSLLGELPETTEQVTQAPQTDDQTTQDAQTNQQESSAEQNTAQDSENTGCGALVIAPAFVIMVMIGAVLVTKKKE